MVCFVGLARDCGFLAWTFVVTNVALSIDPVMLNATAQGVPTFRVRTAKLACEFGKALDCCTSQHSRGLEQVDR